MKQIKILFFFCCTNFILFYPPSFAKKIGVNFFCVYTLQSNKTRYSHPHTHTHTHRYLLHIDMSNQSIIQNPIFSLFHNIHAYIHKQTKTQLRPYMSYIESNQNQRKKTPPASEIIKKKGSELNKKKKIH